MVINLNEIIVGTEKCLDETALWTWNHHLADDDAGMAGASPRKISYSLPAKCDNCYFPLQYLKQENATSMSFSAQSLWSLKAKMKVGRPAKLHFSQE